MGEINLRNKLNIGKTKFGIEIEFDETNLENIRHVIENGVTIEKEDSYNHWIVKEDFSVTRGTLLGYTGGEVVSPILTDNYMCYQGISNACSIIKLFGGQSSDLTSAQIHIDGDIIEENPKYLINIIKLWIAYEDIIYKFGYNGSTPRRAINSYASPLVTYYSKLEDIEKCNTIPEILDIIAHDRNYGINFKNLMNAYKKYNKRSLNTIEIRCPNGTLDPVVWQNIINFFVKLLLYAKSDDFDSKVVDGLLSDIKPPVNKILYNNLVNEYSVVNIKKAESLSNLIFTDNVDKKRFLKQYKR